MGMVDLGRFPKEMEKMLDCKLIFSDQEFKVQGLEKADTVDPFSILQVEYEGISPNGSAYLQSNAKDEFESMIQFETDKSNGLSNGDILTVSVNDDNADYLLSNYGKILPPLQKEYTVEGLDEYVGSWNELTDDFKAMLKAESEDKIYAYTASEYAKSSLLSNLSYKGYIFSTLKMEKKVAINTITFILFIVERCQAQIIISGQLRFISPLNSVIF